MSMDRTLTLWISIYPPSSYCELAVNIIVELCPTTVTLDPVCKRQNPHGYVGGMDWTWTSTYTQNPGCRIHHPKFKTLPYLRLLNSLYLGWEILHSKVWGLGQAIIICYLYYDSKHIYEWGWIDWSCNRSPDALRESVDAKREVMISGDSLSQPGDIFHQDIIVHLPTLSTLQSQVPCNPAS